MLNFTSWFCFLCKSQPSTCAINFLRDPQATELTIKAEKFIPLLSYPGQDGTAAVTQDIDDCFSVQFQVIVQHSCNWGKHSQDWNNLSCSYIIFLLYFQKENLHATSELQDSSVKNWSKLNIMQLLTFQTPSEAATWVSLRLKCLKQREIPRNSDQQILCICTNLGFRQY